MEQVADAGNFATTIPVDLIVDILSLLPAKSIIRFQSVSKQWFSIIRSKYLVDTFLIRSKTRPHLLLVLELSKPGKRFLFSVPEHKINDKTSTAIARHDMTRSPSRDVYYFSSLPVNGFVCFTGIISSTGLCNSITVCNPITRQTVKLPDVRNKGRKVYELLGYDPVEDQYKVLCVITCVRYRSVQVDNQQEHYVCTVSSSEKQEWRKIENTSAYIYRHIYPGICIDGVIYYGIEESNIVKFDVRSEKMELIKAPEESNSSNLVNYNGRLGGVEFIYYKHEIRLWILEDIEKQQWSSMKFSYPRELGNHLVSNGVIHTGELMVFQRSLKEADIEPFCVYYYDFNKESSRKVEIQGVETDEKRGTRLCYPGYIENIRFL
ncbi:F-box family protein [Raphanus sativus]|uniref:F-box protein At1g46984 n=1 Tax=Raphanus sativus TaxID=3726 RepID=A0A6J0MN94_RAPSA|nr:putative F-box protein At1g46984 [Raphanus sativus]XP_056861712.1 putative F-box protein At1g46984 [Raphanus sativus]KAJ4867316.1 F-box family protein [Raphanus sativus]KAJ4906474.1 F-box family protein [Raphanus sativus]